VGKAIGRVVTSQDLGRHGKGRWERKMKGNMKDGEVEEIKSRRALSYLV
jgi:hypothetical protein